MTPLKSPLLALLTLPLGASITPRAEAQARTRVAEAAREASVPFPFASPEVKILKAAHRLELWASGRLVKGYPVGLGHRGLADKRRQGDHLTPEGRYYVCSRGEQSAFHLFLGISYPGEDAAGRGAKEGLITPHQHDQILGALRRKACPPWNTALGGTVGIHGGGSRSDWTWGCIALEDAGIEELWVACPLGTAVVIEP